MTLPDDANSSTSLATLFAQADGFLDPFTGGVVPPIQPSTTFGRDEANRPLNHDHIYGRGGNDLMRLGERILATAEGAAGGLLFPSGMAAIAALMRTVPGGGKILLQSGIYWGTTKWIREFAGRRDIGLREIDASNTALLEKEIRQFSPDIVFIETPSNPWLKVTDIAAAAKSCGEANALLVVDSTAATPAHAKPLEHGADIVMHSATKAINGHSDVLAGFLAVKDTAFPIWDQIETDREEAGALLGSFEAWLLVRGMRTLPLRMERMSASALKIAEHMKHHMGIEDVLYPGLSSHPGHAIAKRQMHGGYGSLLSVLIKGDGAAAIKVSGRLKLFHRATSLGGVESLVEHRHTIEQGVAPNLLRLSIGIEDADELIEDLENALAYL